MLLLSMFSVALNARRNFWKEYNRMLTKEETDQLRSIIADDEFRKSWFGQFVNTMAIAVISAIVSIVVTLVILEIGG